ncbi:MAG: hypothetical protein ACJ76H_02905, partial [Bacteriovoracaceae bacterium]
WFFVAIKSEGGFMTLNKLLLLGLFALATNAFAAVEEYDQTKFYTINQVTVSEISHDVILDHAVQKTVSEAYLDQQTPGTPGRIETAGRIISMGRDLVALGEDIYRLVSKGKPNVTTAYDPISVIPKENGRPVDLMDTESWSMPAKRTYQLTLKNLYGIAVVTFRYSVIFSYNGSYNGTGKYITAAQIQPDYVNVLWGFDFSATMKLSGIQNQGTKANPTAAATLRMEYTASNVMNSRTIGDTYFITGRGGFKKL